jgi:hypothetical protein
LTLAGACRGSSGGQRAFLGAAALMASRPSAPAAEGLPAVATDMVTASEARRALQRAVSVMYGRVEAALWWRSTSVTGLVTILRGALQSWKRSTASPLRKLWPPRLSTAAVPPQPTRGRVLTAPGTCDEAPPRAGRWSCQGGRAAHNHKGAGSASAAQRCKARLPMVMIS